MGAQITAKDVAKYFLYKSDPIVGETISNLKLQKLVYYAQGFHLAIFEKPLFNERIHAWVYGPVVVDLYHQYKDFGNKSIDIPEEFDFSMFSSKQLELFDDVYDVYGQFSALALMDMTHEESPYKSTKINQIIDNKKLLDFFKNQIEK